MTDRANSENTSVSVLIVEDDLELSAMWQQYLQEQNYAVDVCGSVEDAEILLHSKSYNVAVIDIFLREGNRVLSEGGITLINRLRLNETTKSQPRVMVLAVTGAPERAFGEFNALDSVTDLADSLLHKPLPLNKLGKEIERLCSATVEP